MLDVRRITEMHRETVVRWHQQEVDNPYSGLLGVACKQHSFNFLLWHEEDVARSTEVGDARIVQAKRNIDRYNQQRNDWIERLDDEITVTLQQLGVEAAPDAPLNTETPGSAIDRLSILALRMYHLEEQLTRTDAGEDHLRSVEQKLAVCRLQHDDLSGALSQLVADIRSGIKRHRTYRQLKMYNDPALNPYLYNAQKRRAG